MAGALLGTLAVKLRADTAEFVKDLKSAGVGLQGVADTAKKVGAVAAVAFGGMALIGSKFIKVASDMDENMNVVRTSFGKMTPEILAWAKTAASEMGRSEFQMREFAGTTQAMLAPMVGNKEAAAKMSTQIAQLAVDIGSFNNVADADALIAIKAGLIGSIEPMMKFGVVMNVAALEAFALAQGVDRSMKDMSAAEKVALRYAFIMEKTALQQGDAAKTAAGYANVMKGIEGLMTDIAGEIGAAMLPAITRMAQGIKDLLVWFKSLSPEVKAFAGQGLIVATALVGMVAGLAGVAAFLPAIIEGVGVLAGAAAAAAPWVLAVGVAAATAAVLVVGYQEISKTSTTDIGLMWKQLGEDIRDSLGFMEGETGGIMDTLRTMWRTLVADVKGLWGEAMDWIGATALGGLLGDIVDFAIDSLKAWSFVGEGIAKTFTDVFNWLRDSWLGSVVGVFLSIWMGVQKAFIMPFRLAFSAIGETIDFWGKKLGILSTGTEKAAAAAGAAGGGVAALASPAQSAVVKDALEAFKSLARAGKKKTKAEKAAANVTDDLADAVKKTADVIKKMAKAAVGTGKSLEQVGKDLLKQSRVAGRPFIGAGLAVRTSMDDPREGTAAGEADRLRKEEKEQEPPGQTTRQAMKAAVQIFSSTIIGAAGELGGVMNSAMQGFQAGGPIGAFAAVIADLATRTESFKVSVQNADAAMGEIVEAFEPLAKNMKPLAALINEILVIIAEQLGPVFEALQPAFDFLFDIVKFGALTILRTAKFMGTAWNRLIDLVADVVNAIPGIDIDFSRLQFNLNGVNRAIESLEDITVSSARAEQLNAEATADATDTIRALNESLTNIPEGFKVAAARVRAIDEGIGGQGAVAGDPTAQNAINVTMVVNDTEEAGERLIEFLEERGFGTTGSRVAGLSHSVATGGA